jgi:hypothetical protein
MGCPVSANSSQSNALVITDEILQLIKGLELLVYGELNEKIADVDKRTWAQFGVILAFQKMRNTMEYLKVLASEAYSARIKEEDVN